MRDEKESENCIWASEQSWEGKKRAMEDDVEGDVEGDEGRGQKIFLFILFFEEWLTVHRYISVEFFCVVCRE